MPDVPAVCVDNPVSGVEDGVPSAVEVYDVAAVLRDAVVRNNREDNRLELFGEVEAARAACRRNNPDAFGHVHADHNPVLHMVLPRVPCPVHPTDPIDIS